MADNEIEELRSELRGMGLILSMVLASLDKDAELAAKLRMAEDQMRQENRLSGAIKIVRSYRMMLEGEDPRTNIKR